MRPTIEVPTELFMRLWDYAFADRGELVDAALRDEIRPYAQLALLPEYRIVGTRWFSRHEGNTYHKVRIFENGELVYTSGMAYGYDQQFLDTAFAWLKANRELPPVEDRSFMSTVYLREVLHGTYSVRDVDRKRDL